MIPRVVLAIVDDLFFQAKIQAVAASLGVDVRVASTFARAQAAWTDPAAVIVDLHCTSADPLEVVRTLRMQRPAVPIIGYGSHVQAELFAQAQAAGCTSVLPRSVFVQQLPRLLAPFQSMSLGTFLGGLIFGSIGCVALRFSAVLTGALFLWHD